MVWGGEFGRTPMCEIRKPRDANNAGRDHHPLAYSLFLAGGGIKGGTVVGKTDDLCMNMTEDKVHVHDLQATMLHCLGPGSHAPDLPPHGPRFPAHGRGGQRRAEDAGVTRREGFKHSVRRRCDEAGDRN